jgi:putative ABC transport system permease protein
LRQALWTFLTLISHWRRHPANFGALLAGLAVATALWSGVQALNEQARKSYDRAAAVFSGGGVSSLVPTRGGPFPQDLYIKLRLSGWKVSPILEGRIRIGAKSFRLIGVEPLTLPKQSQLTPIGEVGEVGDFIKPPGQTILSPETLRDMELAEGATPQVRDGKTLPPLKTLGNSPPGVLVVDIGVAQRLLEQPDRLSRLLVDDRQRIAVAPLERVTGDELRLTEPDEDQDLSRLTDSFHLNLTAFGMLAYLVGLFIVHASFGLAFEQRLPMLRTMRAVGVSMRALFVSMLGELFALALIAGGAGVISGYLIATALLPDVAASLEGLYAAQVADQLNLNSKWWLSGLGMALLGALVAAAGGFYKALRLPVLSAAQPFAWREAQQKYLRRQGLLASLGFSGALLAYCFAGGLYGGFLLIAGLLLGAALLLPLVLAFALRLGETCAKGPVTRWFLADSRQQLPGLSLALMALLLALATNIGVGAMVAGFRQTFTQWLDERLVAEVYFEAADTSAAKRIEAWLEKRADIAAILPVWKTKTRISGWPTDVIGLRSHETYREHFPMLSKTENAWEDMRHGGAVLVSEQLARRLRLGLGSLLDIPTSGGVWRAKVAGIYPDYGNPKGQLRVDLDALPTHWPDAQRASYSLRVAPAAVPGLIQALQAEFGSKIARVVDQAEVKELSMRIFERTFAVTAALNTLTLIVSAIALFATLLTLSNLRIAQLAPVWAIGVTRSRLSQFEFARILSFALATAIFAIPLGLALAWCLVAIVNVEAFGWRLPFHVFPSQWAQVLALALLAAAVVAVAPVIRLARTAPADLLKAFANER